MGEYAKYNGKEIKMGTCSNMYCLRYDQRMLVHPMLGSVNPRAEAGTLWFRLPLEEEKDVEPGAFDFHGFGGAVPIWFRPKVGSQLAEDVDQLLGEEADTGIIQLTSSAGILMNIPCNHGRRLKHPPEGLFYNCFQTDTLGIGAVGIRWAPDGNGGGRWHAMANIYCLACGNPVFRFTLEELENNVEPLEPCEGCFPYGKAQTGAVEKLAYVIRYMHEMEKDANSSVKSPEKGGTC